MILNNLISPLINCARKSVDDFHFLFINRADNIENEVGFIVIEMPGNPVGFDPSLVFDQVDSTLRSCVRKFLWWELFNLSQASPLNFSCNFRLLLSWFSKLHFFLSSCMIFGGFLCLSGGEARTGVYQAISIDARKGVWVSAIFSFKP